MKVNLTNPILSIITIFDLSKSPQTLIVMLPDSSKWLVGNWISAQGQKHTDQLELLTD